MIEPWFSNETARWFPFFSMLGLLALLEIPAERGVYRKAVMATGMASVLFGVAMFIAGVIAVVSGQPRFVSGPLLLVGFVVGVTCFGGMRGLRKSYAAAELRKINAADL